MPVPSPMSVPDVADLERELAEFWRQASSGDAAVVRACSVNLVVVCRDGEPVQDSTSTIAALSEVRPGRAFLVALRGDETDETDDRLTAFVSAHCHRGPGGKQVCSEQVTLHAHGRGRRWVPDTLLQMLVEDCPVFTWWRRRRTAADSLWRPLAELSDRLIVDTAVFDDPARALQDLQELTTRSSVQVGDLEWSRLTPWREMVASLFDSAPAARWLTHVTALSVSAGGPALQDGRTLAGAYLVGWLASRLGLGVRDSRRLEHRDGTPVELHFRHDDRLPAGQPAAVKIQCRDQSRHAGFVVQRLTPEGRVARLESETGGACPLPYTQRLAEDSDAELLRAELERGWRDSTYTEALRATRALLV